jgi:serine/threonine protein kinase
VWFFDVVCVGNCDYCVTLPFSFSLFLSPRYVEEYKELLCSKGALPVLLEFARQGKIQISKEIKRSQLQCGRLLGSGAFAKVFEGRYNGKLVAIKVFSESSFAFRLEDFYCEVAIMSMISHPHIVRFEGACIEHKRDEEGVFMIVTELMHKGSLRNLIDKTYHGPLPLEKTLRYATHVALGMRHLHRFNIVHRDLKAENVLINQDDIAKIADFGLSREINIDNGMTIMAGTPKWEAPEVLVGSKRKGGSGGDGSKTSRYSKEADVYSYAMTLYEMVTGMQPFAEIHDIFELKKMVCDKHKRPELPSSCPAPLANLIKLCWHKDPAKRPSFEQILNTLQQIHTQFNIPFSVSASAITSASSLSNSLTIVVSAPSSPSPPTPHHHPKN